MNKIHVGQPGLGLLNIQCHLLAQAFGPCFLVGECLDRRDYRHVDVRMILPNDQFAMLFDGQELRLALVGAGLTRLLSDASGLPVDFQIQSQAWSDARFADRPRVPIGDLA